MHLPHALLPHVAGVITPVLALTMREKLIEGVWWNYGESEYTLCYFILFYFINKGLLNPVPEHGSRRSIIYLSATQPLTPRMNVFIVVITIVVIRAQAPSGV